MSEAIKFEAGNTYYTRSAGDHNCIFSYEVVKRTSKMITIKTDEGVKRCGIHIVDGIEAAYPEGRYSMCPVIKANRHN